MRIECTFPLIVARMLCYGIKVLFYHSNTKIPGVFGLAHVAREGYPDCEPLG